MYEVPPGRVALGPAGCYAVFFHQLAVTDRRSGVSAESGSWSIETAVTPIKTAALTQQFAPLGSPPDIPRSANKRSGVDLGRSTTIHVIA
jgi:hypothetical protein